MQVDVCFTPDEYYPERYAGYTVVVIDVLRATSTIVTAIANGCLKIIPVDEIDKAWEKKKVFPAALLTGERLGRKIDGFDLGNSPLEFSPAVVGTRTIIMTTTNGTRAFFKCRNAQRVIAAAFLNAGTVGEKLRREAMDTVIVCSGTKGRFSLEDTLCAGIIVNELGKVARPGNQALAAELLYKGSGEQLGELAARSDHAIYLKHIGMGRDVEYCLQTDNFKIAPVYKNGIITV